MYYNMKPFRWEWGGIYIYISIQHHGKEWSRLVYLTDRHLSWKRDCTIGFWVIFFKSTRHLLPACSSITSCSPARSACVRMVDDETHLIYYHRKGRFLGIQSYLMSSKRTRVSLVVETDTTRHNNDYLWKKYAVFGQIFRPAFLFICLMFPFQRHLR